MGDPSLAASCGSGPGMEPWVTEHSRQPVLSVALAPDYGAADRGIGFGATIRINKKA